MNRVQINLKSGNSVFILDDEDLTVDQLSENLATLFSVNSVAILNSNNSSLIIRPSDISSIKVEESNQIVSDDSDEKPKVEKLPAPPKKQPEPEEAIDIITDMDPE